MGPIVRLEASWACFQWNFSYNEKFSLKGAVGEKQMRFFRGTAQMANQQEGPHYMSLNAEKSC